MVENKDEENKTTYHEQGYNLMTIAIALFQFSKAESFEILKQLPLQEVYTKQWAKI